MDTNDFQRKVDKSQIPACKIMGVYIAAVNIKWLLNFTDKHIGELSGDYMCVANVHTTVMAFEDPEYRAIQNRAIMAIPDGGPLSTVGRRRGHRMMCRIAGPDYMSEIFKISVEKGYRHYFYGSTEQTLEKLYKTLTGTYPGLQIVGMYSPPFRDIKPEEDEEIVHRINEARSDFVWVGLGAPKQEKWMAAHQGRVNGFLVGVGAGFDYYAGNIERAPKWMQNSNLEWLYRLLQEPVRLFGRYLHTNTRFIWYAYLRGK